MSRSIRNVSLVAVALIVGLVGYSLLTRKGDQQLIQDALDQATLASQEGRPGSVLEYLSKSFEINGSEIINRDAVARFIRDQKPKVTLESTVADVNGATAVVVTPVELKMSPPFNLSTSIPNVRIELAKEQTTRFLVIPDRQWRIVKVTVPPESWAQFGQ